MRRTEGAGDGLTDEFGSGSHVGSFFLALLVPGCCVSDSYFHLIWGVFLPYQGAWPTPSRGPLAQEGCIWARKIPAPGLSARQSCRSLGWIPLVSLGSTVLTGVGHQSGPCRRLSLLPILHFLCWAIGSLGEVSSPQWVGASELILSSWVSFFPSQDKVKVVVEQKRVPGTSDTSWLLLSQSQQSCPMPKLGWPSHTSQVCSMLSICFGDVMLLNVQYRDIHTLGPVGNKTSLYMQDWYSQHGL